MLNSLHHLDFPYIFNGTVMENERNHMEPLLFRSVDYMCVYQTLGNWLLSSSHLVPVYADRQVQVNDFPFLLQVPPFKQGFD